MIFKIFDSDIDNLNQNVGFGESLKNKLFSKKNNNNDWIKNSLENIIPKDNTDSYIAELDLNSAKEKLENIFNWDDKIKNNKATWQDYFGTLDKGEDYIVDLIKNTDDLSKLTGEDLVNANQQARESTISHNEAIKAQTFSSKAGKVALQALATAGNMLAGFAILKGIELATTAIDNWIHRTEKANEAIEDARSQYENSKSEIESTKAELENTKQKISELESKGVLSFTDEAELDKLKQQNDELERTLMLQEKKKENEADKGVATIHKNKKELFDDFENTITNYSDYENEYNKTDQIGIKGVKNGNISVEHYEETMNSMDDVLADYKNTLLDRIEKFEAYRNDIINKYETDDVSTFSLSDQKLFDDINKKLNEAYHAIYSDSEYNKIVIEPIFKKDEFDGIYDQMLQFFVSGGNSDSSSLEDKFGTDIIQSLQNACKNAGVDFDKIIGDIYNNSQKRLNQIAPIIENPNGAYDAKQNLISNNIRDYVQNELSEEDRTILLYAEIPDDQEFKTTKDVQDFIDSLKDKANENPISSPLSFSQSWESLASDTKNELLELAKAGEISDATLKSNADYKTLIKDTGLTAREARYEIMSMVSVQDKMAGFQSKMESIATLYNEFKDKGFVTAGTLNELPDVFKEMNGGKDFDLFSKIAGDPTSGREKIKAAFGDIVTAYIQDQDILVGTTNKTRDSVVANLKDAGVTNAAEVVDSYLNSMNLIQNAENEFSNKSAQQRAADISNFQKALKDKNTSFSDACKVLGTNNAALMTSMGRQYADDYINWLKLIDKKKKTYNKFAKSYNKATNYKDEDNSIFNRVKNGESASSYFMGIANDKRKADEAAAEEKAGREKLTKYKTIDFKLNPADYKPKNISGASNSKKTDKDNTKSTQIIDWISRRLEVLQSAIDLTKCYPAD